MLGEIPLPWTWPLGPWSHIATFFFWGRITPPSTMLRGIKGRTNRLDPNEGDIEVPSLWLWNSGRRGRRLERPRSCVWSFVATVTNGSFSLLELDKCALQAWRRRFVS